MNKLGIEMFDSFNDYLVLNKENTKIVFSTAIKDRSFNRNTEDGVSNLNNIKNEFDVEKVLYLKQVHSDETYIYNDQVEEVFIENEGDSIITDKKNIAIGVFTADCVPIILVDNRLGVTAAIHSGWKGTYNSIVKKTIEKMINKFNCKVEDIHVYIGPHIRKCCYEVSEELKEDFLLKTGIEESVLFDGRKLSMEECILSDLREININENNINTLDICTYCSKDLKLHSYRKAAGTYGRLFTFVINK